MMVPPKQDDLAARLDPTKQRARKFNTGKGAKGANAAAGENDLWSETPEQKRKRLEDEMLGISKPGQPTAQASGRESSATRDEESARRIREHTVGADRVGHWCCYTMLMCAAGENTRQVAIRPASNNKTRGERRRSKQASV